MLTPSELRLLKSSAKEADKELKKIYEGNQPS